MPSSKTSGAGFAWPATIAGRPELARPPRVCMKRVLAYSILGSVAVILVALAARPSAIDKTEALVDQALSLYGKGDRDGARRVADDLVKVNPGEPRAWLLLGMLHEDRKSWNEAERAYSVALEVLDQKDARRVDVQVTLADLRRRKGDPLGALAAIDKVARERGVTGRMRHARVLALIDLARYDEALSETRLIAEEKFGGGVARKLEKQIRSLKDAGATRDG
jgi:Flp pilus assembly protein TadD